MEPRRATGLFSFSQSGRPRPTDSVFDRLLQKNKLTLDTIGRNADGIGLFKIFSPSNFTGKTKDPNRDFIQADWIRTPNSLEIHSALFEMRFFKKGAKLAL